MFFSYYFWDKLSDIHLYFSCCNFSNRLNFESLTEDEIDQIEQIVREKGIDFVEKKINGRDQVFTEEQLIDFFGETYASDPSYFRFEIGDKKLIRILRDHLIKQKNEKGVKYMRRFRKKPDFQKPKKTKFDHGDDTLKIEAKYAIKDDTFTVDDDDLCHQLSANLFERMKVYMETFGTDDAIMQKIDSNIVSVKIVDELIIAEVLCAVCQHDPTKKRKLKGKRVFYKGGEGSKYWVLSNFGQHLKNVHKMTSRLFVNEQSDETPEENNQNGSEPLNFDALVKKEVTTSDEKLALAHNFSVEYIENLENSEQTTSPDNPNVIYDQITAQIRKMVEATLLNNDSMKQMIFQLNEDRYQQLKIAEVAANGSCLFASIVHQLFAEKIGSRKHIRTTDQLRVNVCKYITRNYSSFKHELQGRVYEEINASLITDLNKECKDILEQYMPMRDYWGGSETLKAVQEIYNVNILIFNERDTCYFFNQFNEANTRTLILAFRFTNSNERNHYDSVCDISSQEILNSIKFLSTKPQEGNAYIDQTL